MRSVLVLAATAGLILGSACPAAYSAETKTAAAPRWKREQLDFFENRIRPVLVQHCYACHAAEADSLKGGLSLEHRQALLDGGDSGAAIVPGKPEESLLIEALRYESLEMPPEGKLPEAVIRDFERWVRMGAPDPRAAAATTATLAGNSVEAGREFWAFQAPQRHAPPGVADAAWPDTWIDRFVLARLEQAGLQPAADADRQRLLRRLSYDLTGLPPTAEDLAAFEADESPDALARVVDRLLDSPQFGEHWGRHWLDVARYADSNGSDFNATFHEAWRYRNYVIEAFNRDKPFNQFLREQLAGDLLPYDSDRQRTEQLVATGFLMLGAKMLSERDKLKLRMDVVDEQVDTVGRAMLGMTLGCARCHDHKFDPIPTADYYALAGIFRSTQTLDGEMQQYVSNWVRQPLPLEPQHAEALALHEQARRQLSSRMEQAKQHLTQMEKELAAATAGTVVVDDDAATLTGRWVESTFSKTYIGRGYRHDDRQDKGGKSITYEARLPQTGRYELRLAYSHGANRADNVPVRIEHAEGAAELELNQQVKPPIDGMYVAMGQFSFAADQPARVTLSNRGTAGYVIVDAVAFVPLEAAAAEATDAGAASGEAIRKQFDQAQQTMKRLEDEMKQLQSQAPPPRPVALAVREEPKIENSPIYIRGEVHNAGRVVDRGFLQVASFDRATPLPEGESGRRQLADWVADSRNPLTARVMVNRLWYHLLGEGLVRSVDNFGVLGERPTHPELLDTLAVEFVERGWSVKQLVRQIVLSRVYRLATDYDETCWNADPENRLLWRAHRKRIPAESLRDTLLALGGRLELLPGESPVAGFGELVRSNTADDAGTRSAESLRRTVYQPVIRNELPALLTVFDFADPDFVTGQRPRTNVPSQALLLLNSPFVRESAERAARRLLDELPATSDVASRAGVEIDRQRVRQAYRLVVGRDPQPAEIERALEFVQPIVNAPAPSAEADLPERRELDAWTTLVHALMASTEFRLLD